jgi:hypothetical protein
MLSLLLRGLNLRGQVEHPGVGILPRQAHLFVQVGRRQVVLVEQVVGTPSITPGRSRIVPCDRPAR